MSDMAMSVADLATYLERVGGRVLRDGDGETIGLELDDGRVAALRWTPRSRAVLLAIPTGLNVPVAYYGATLLELARVNDELEAPGFTLELDDGSVNYRARLVARGDGRLDLDVFDGTLRAALECVEHALPRLRNATSRTRHSAVHNAATAFAGYVE